jgi:hypothetical protein
MLENLEELELGETKIRTILPIFQSLVRLRSLDLGDNCISLLPDYVEGFDMLEALYLNNCRLESLPDWIYQLPRLNRLTLNGNTFQPKAFEALQRWKASRTLTYFQPPCLKRKQNLWNPHFETPLTKEVNHQIERLGGTFSKHISGRQSIKWNHETWILPKAFSQLWFELAWPGSVYLRKLPDGTQEGITFDRNRASIEYFYCVHNHPLLPIMCKSEHGYGYYMIDLEDEHPEDPEIFTSFNSTDADATSLGLRLSGFLQSLELKI